MVLEDIRIDSLWDYIKYIVGFSLLIRLFLALFKAAAIRQKEADDIEERKLFSDWGRWEAIWKSFFSWGHHRNIDDYWLPAIIGTIEMFIFPILMVLEQWTAIMAWVGIKTAVHWGKWKESRTPYNRYLLGSILVIAYSYLILTKFITKV